MAALTFSAGSGGKKAGYNYAVTHTMMYHTSTYTKDNSPTRQAAYIKRSEYRNRLVPYISTNKPVVLNILCILYNDLINLVGSKRCKYKRLVL